MVIKTRLIALKQFYYYILQLIYLSIIIYQFFIDH